MNLNKRILSTLLAVTMLLSSMLAALTFEVAAAEQEGSPLDVEDYILATNAFKTPEDKLASMKFMYREDSGRYELYADTVTGEVACLDTASRQILFTNPYDVAAHTAEDPIKEQLLSQIMITYRPTSDDKSSYLYSYTSSAKNGQLKVQQIKKGIRVEYTIGREDSNMILPQRIYEDRFEELIKKPLQEAVDRGELDQSTMDAIIGAWFPQDHIYNGIPSSAQYEMIETANAKYGFLMGTETIVDGEKVYPVFYDFSSTVPVYKAREYEDYIKKFTDYSEEDLEEDQQLTPRETDQKAEPLFKLSLEYYADENGMTVRLPSNGIRYDMSEFQLEEITVLPYISAGDRTMDGSIFFPDGSGAIFDYEYMQDKEVTVSAKVYGEDFGYQKLVGMKNEKVVRYPVIGSVSTEKIYSWGDKKVSATVQSLEDFKAELEQAGAVNPKINVDEYQRGVLAVIESADSLSYLKLHGGAKTHYYSLIQAAFNPKPKDTYRLDATKSSITVVSDRKYSGSFTMRFFMLTDEKNMKSDATYYDTDWMGMAEAYRDYLGKIGVLDALKDSEVEKDIPLYIESFGALETQESIATVPVYLMTPLTTFDNVWSMYQKLSESNVKNINFKLTGFANGGMYYEVPSALKWENALGGADGFKELINKANEVNQKEDGSHLGLYPDFDFAYIQTNNLFDALILNDDAVKGIDNRYTRYRQYSPTQQTHLTFYQLILAPSRYSKFYTELLANYAEYDLKSLSIASLGSALNTDFDEEDPYNREDSKQFTAQAFAYMKENGYSIMTESANSYAWKYADHILNVDLDSSRRLQASASVPFIGVVLHGSVQFAGAPLNEEGDINYALLRAIENGAGMYFLLSYQNTTKLKSDTNLSQYYSIRYDIWQEDIIKYYNQLNLALKDVQTKYIIDHQFLTGERILDLDELEDSIADKLEEADRLEKEEYNNAFNASMNAVSDAWALLHNAKDRMETITEKITAVNAKVAAGLISVEDDLAAAIATLNAAFAALEQAKADAAATPDPADEGDGEGEGEGGEPVDPVAEAQKVYDEALKALTAQINTSYASLLSLIDAKIELDALNAEAKALVDAIDPAIAVVETSDVYANDEETRAVLLAQMQAYKAEFEANGYYDAAIAAYEVYKDILNIKGENSVFKTAADENAKIFGEANEYGFADIETIKADCSASIFTLADLDERYDALTEVEEDQESSNTSVVADDNNNKIVAVTYGNGKDDPYKTFILNYNSYAVRVNYLGQTYIIASGEYVVLTHSANNS